MATFTQRTEAPDSSNAYYYANNPFYQAGYGLPNCTCYAWGRFYEISGQRPKLSTGDAEKWFGYTSDGYSRGQTPKLGAVICWSKGSATDDSDGAGHVEVVEAINPDGTIVTTGSAYNSWMFRRKTRTNDGNWEGGAYTFQGFIYNPVDFDGSTTAGGQYKPKTPISSNKYLTLSQMQTNAEYIAWYMLQRGWTLNAIAGMLGNMQTESTINPGLWESLDEGNTSGGVGLVQWTPATRHLEWCAERGLDYAAMNSNLKHLEFEVNDGDDYYPTANYPETFAEFKVSTKDPNYLALAFLANYERPKNPNQPIRGEQAEYWYTYLSGIDFSGSGSMKKRKKYNFILFGNKQWRNTV